MCGIKCGHNDIQVYVISTDYYFFNFKNTISSTFINKYIVKIKTMLYYVKV